MASSPAPKSDDGGSPRLDSRNNEKNGDDGGALSDDVVGVTHVVHSSKETEGEDILALQDLDPALNTKMHLVNNAIDEIGWTNYHWKMFGLNGFGYAVDSLVLILQSVIAAPAYKEFRWGYKNALTMAAYTGMLLGAVFWGLLSDIMGRRHCFNVSLFVCSTATILCAAMPNWWSLAIFVAVVGFGAGGNLILDTTVFLEYLPSNKQWVLTFLACWWGFGQAITGFIAWGFLAPERLNCESAETCSRENNMGWRYTMITAGFLVLVMSILRVTVVRLRETPKYLLGMGEDAKLVETMQAMAARYNRPCSLTLEQLQACGVVSGAHSGDRFSVAESVIHLKGLFATRKMALSTLLVWVSWAMMGLAYPLFYVFLDSYLTTRGASLDISTYDTWRNYALVNVTSIFGPMLAGYLCDLRQLGGRRPTMVMGALATAALFFGYSAVRTRAQNLGFSCAIAFSINVYYGTLYAYTPEVLPSAHRATGNGVAVACNRVMGILSAVIGTVADTATPVPIFICASLFVALAGLSLCLPFEPFGRRSS